MTGPRCIVCGKAIAKQTTTIFFSEPWANNPEGSVKRDTFSTTYYLGNPPRTKAEAQRYSNHQVVSVRRGRREGTVGSVGVWDGESYQDRFFHSNECAIKQGYASAQHGARFNWRRE